MKYLISILFLVAAFAVSSAPAAHAAAFSPDTVSGTTTVDAAAAKALFNQGVPFVDVRKDSDWDAGRIPGAEHLELKKVFDEAKLAEIAGKDQEVVIYCNGPKCMRSSEACAKAVSWGFKKVYYFRGGFPEWAAADYPTE
jgi:rhodanese-related sulfurtransferase